MNVSQNSVTPDAKLNQIQAFRFDDHDQRLRQLEAEVRELRSELQKMRLLQARMLGFLQGRGVTGMAAAEPDPVS